MFEEEFAKLPVDPPRRIESLPGLRLGGAIPKSMLILPLIFVALFAFIPLSIMRADPAMRLAMGPTESTQGRVVSNNGGSACRGAASHRLTYAFASKSGGAYRATATVCEESPYYSVSEGEAIEVRYLTSDPTVSALPDSRNEAPPFALFMFMPAFVLAIFIPMFWPSVREVLRARRLFKTGRLTTGTVLFVKKRMTSVWPGMPGSSASAVYVEFQTSSGARREAVAWCQNDWLMSQLVAGAKVHIACSDEKSANVALLEAFFR
jgi:hypothetical protein